MSEAYQIQQAVLESKQLGTLSPKLITLITKMVHRRVSPQLEDDIRQQVLLSLLSKLPTITVPTSYEYIGITITNTWKQYMRSRFRERKYLFNAMEKQIDQLPSHQRPHARSEAFGSYLVLLKYY